MTGPPIGRDASRRARNAERRRSRRPSRLGTLAGTAASADYVIGADAGFPSLLQRAWQRASLASDLTSAVRVLLTIDGHVPADVQLRALARNEEAALEVLFGLSWRPERRRSEPALPASGAGTFLGEIGLSSNGRVAVRTPSQPPLDSSHKLVGGVLRVPWTMAALRDYHAASTRADRRYADAVADCRRYLAAMGPDERQLLLDQLKQAALRTAPFILYHEHRQYTNFRDRNTLTGKTLWPGHPDCALSALDGMPLDLWSDEDAVMVVSLMLLVRSAGFARIEEANGTQLTVDHVAYLLEQARWRYNKAAGSPPVAAAGSRSVAAIADLATALRDRREQLRTSAQLYREIHGVLMHKVELVAGPLTDEGQRREVALCDRLRESLPLDGASLADLGEQLRSAPHWLAKPHGRFETGLEALVYETVRAANHAFVADFAMSRGTRSIPQLIDALRREDWQTIADWEISAFYCCVVPAPDARRHFGGSYAHLADTAWAISSRMQYNSWHFIAGDLPKLPVIEARDYFVPPTMPDIAYYADQHHRGHVASKVRFSIRSPQPVRVLDRTFNGFVDLRLLRCDGVPFHEQDLLAAHRTSAFIATATALAADLVAQGTELETTSFDARWHWDTIVPAATGPGSAS